MLTEVPPLFTRSRLGLMLLWCVSLFFFVFGLAHPFLETGVELFETIVIKKESIYLYDSFRYFFNAGDPFIGILLLLFTLILPAVKYLFLLGLLWKPSLMQHRRFFIALDIINKWSMLDVFVVALLIMNMKFDSNIILSKLRIGTSYFALSVVLLMVLSLLLKYRKPVLNG